MRCPDVPAPVDSLEDTQSGQFLDRRLLEAKQSEYGLVDFVPGPKAADTECVQADFVVWVEGGDLLAEILVLALVLVASVVKAVLPFVRALDVDHDYAFSRRIGDCQVCSFDGATAGVLLVDEHLALGVEMRAQLVDQAVEDVVMTLGHRCHVHFA